jgi:hypothetical protein
VTGKNFLIEHGSSSAGVADLGDNVDEGDRVTANFTLAKQCADKQFSLVVYKSPTFVFESWRANEDTVYDSATGFFGPGPNTLAVDVPACHFYIAFVLGGVIENMGPEGTDNFYSAQGKLVSDDAGDPDGENCSDWLPKEEPDGEVLGASFESFSLLVAPEEGGDASSTDSGSLPEDEGQIPGGGAGGGPSTSSGSGDPIADPLLEEPLPEEASSSTEENASSTEQQSEPSNSSSSEEAAPQPEPESPPQENSESAPEVPEENAAPQDPPAETPPTPEPQPEPPVPETPPVEPPVPTE